MAMFIYKKSRSYFILKSKNVVKLYVNLNLFPHVRSQICCWQLQKCGRLQLVAMSCFTVGHLWLKWQIRVQIKNRYMFVVGVATYKLAVIKKYNGMSYIYHRTFAEVFKMVSGRYVMYRPRRTS